MHTISDETILEILRADTGMALGCTEPIAAALAVVKAREVLGARPERISLKVSGNIYKNGMGVGIPGTDKCGIKVAAALGGQSAGSARRCLRQCRGLCCGVCVFGRRGCQHCRKCGQIVHRSRGFGRRAYSYGYGGKDSHQYHARHFGR